MMIIVKDITDIITNSSSEAFVKKLKKSERRYLKLRRTKEINKSKERFPDEPEYWHYISECGVSYERITKKWLLKKEDWEILMEITGIRPEDPRTGFKKDKWGYWEEGSYDQFRAIVDEYNSILWEKLYGKYRIEVSDHNGKLHEEVIQLLGWSGDYPFPLPEGILCFRSLH